MSALLETVAAPPAYSARAESRPLTAFSGDFFFTTYVGDALWFALGDFAGHGLNAAVMTAMVQEELENLIRSCGCSDPAEVVASLDQSIREVMPFNRFATLVVGRALPHGLVQLVNAGHCPPLVRRSSGVVEFVPSSGPVVGLAPAATWSQRALQLEEGDSVVLFSDGLMEAANASGEEFGLERIADVVTSQRGRIFLDPIFDAVKRFAGGMSDDATLLVVTRV